MSPIQKSNTVFSISSPRFLDNFSTCLINKTAFLLVVSISAFVSFILMLTRTLPNNQIAFVWQEPLTLEVNPEEVPTEIYLLDRNTGVTYRLINNNARNWAPAWSADGERLAFSSNQDGDAEIYVMNIDDRSIRRLTYNPAIDYQPTWSPDGTQIAFASTRDGYLSNSTSWKRMIQRFFG